MRRRRLAGALPPGGIAIIPAASRTFMTGAIPYAYRQARPWFTNAAQRHTDTCQDPIQIACSRLEGHMCLAQDSDFLYLTGIDQQAVAVIEASSPLREANFTLYLPGSDSQVCLPLLASSASSFRKRRTYLYLRLPDM
jgi:cellobiose-specific phosphotransferase system component IIC